MPLKEMASTSHKLNDRFAKFKNILKKFKEEKPSTFDQTAFLPLEDVASSRIDNDRTFEEEQETRLEDITQEALKEYLDEYPGISQKYVTEHWANSNVIDKNYGLLSSSPRYFDNRTGDIVIDGQQFKGTPGLYQLIFYYDPPFNEEDKKAYKIFFK